VEVSFSREIRQGGLLYPDPQAGVESEVGAQPRRRRGVRLHRHHKAFRPNQPGHEQRVGADVGTDVDRQVAGLQVLSEPTLGRRLPRSIDEELPLDEARRVEVEEATMTVSRLRAYGPRRRRPGVDGREKEVAIAKAEVTA
jgi:hypothetical protein